MQVIEEITYKDEVRKRFHGVGALHGREWLDPEVATVAGEGDTESELVCCLDAVH